MLVIMFHLNGGKNGGTLTEQKPILLVRIHADQYLFAIFLIKTHIQQQGVNRLGINYPILVLVQIVKKKDKIFQKQTVLLDDKAQDTVDEEIERQTVFRDFGGGVETLTGKLYRVFRSSELLGSQILQNGQDILNP